MRVDSPQPPIASGPRRALGVFAAGALALALLATACDRGSATGDTGETPGFSLLDVMFQIEHAYNEIEPNLRNVDALDETVAAAERILEWSVDPLFEDFTRSARFSSEPAAFLDLRARMESGARSVIDGARTPDLGLLRDGFIEMKQSCIACHKRYSPSY
jgi:hypothetical protein